MIFTMHGSSAVELSFQTSAFLMWNVIEGSKQTSALYGKFSDRKIEKRVRGTS